MEHQQPLRDVDPAVGIDADQMAIKGGVMDLRKRDTVREHRLRQQLVGVGHDVRGIEQMVVGQVADRAAMVIGGEHAVAEGRLVQSLLD